MSGQGKNARVEEVMVQSLLARLSALVDDFPCLRVGQILVNVAGERDLFHMSDEDLDRALGKVLVNGSFV